LAGLFEGLLQLPELSPQKRYGLRNPSDCDHGEVKRWKQLGKRP
jgi:hypothetical protein